MASTFSNLLFHIVYSTKNRLPLIREDLRDRLYSYMGGILANEGGVLLEAGGMPDHVHLCAKLRTDHSVAEIVKTVKANSSGWINREFSGRGRFEWQGGYAAFTVSPSRVAAVRQYIRNQAEHHAKVSFRDELVELLERHGVKYDERFLLG